MESVVAWWEQEAASGPEGRADAYLAIRLEPDPAGAFHADYRFLVDRSASMMWGDWLPSFAEALVDLAGACRRVSRSPCRPLRRPSRPCSIVRRVIPLRSRWWAGNS